MGRYSLDRDVTTAERMLGVFLVTCLAVALGAAAFLLGRSALGPDETDPGKLAMAAVFALACAALLHLGWRELLGVRKSRPSPGMILVAAWALVLMGAGGIVSGVVVGSTEPRWYGPAILALVIGAKQLRSRRR